MMQRLSPRASGAEEPAVAAAPTSSRPPPVPGAAPPAGVRRLVGLALEAQHRARRQAFGRLGIVARPLDVRPGQVTAWHRPTRAPGRPWVFVHGFLGQATNWLDVLRALEPRCPSVWLLDLPGHGLSPPPELPVAAPELGLGIDHVAQSLAAALAAIVEEAGAPPVAVTTSAGALLTARSLLAAGGEGPLAEMSLAAVCPLGAPMGLAWRRRMAAQFGAEVASAGAPSGRPAWVDFVHRLGVEALMAGPFQGRLLAEFAHMPMLAPAEIGALPGDTLVLSGERDHLLTPHSHRLFRRHLPPSATCLSDPDLDHLGVLLRPDRVSATLDHWASARERPLLVQRPVQGSAGRWPWCAPRRP